MEIASIKYLSGQFPKQLYQFSVLESHNGVDSVLKYFLNL